MGNDLSITDSVERLKEWVSAHDLVNLAISDGRRLIDELSQGDQHCAREEDKALKGWAPFELNLCFDCHRCMFAGPGLLLPSPYFEVELLLEFRGPRRPPRVNNCSGVVGRYHLYAKINGERLDSKLTVNRPRSRFIVDGSPPFDLRDPGPENYLAENDPRRAILRQEALDVLRGAEKNKRPPCTIGGEPITAANLIAALAIIYEPKWTEGNLLRAVCDAGENRRSLYRDFLVEILVKLGEIIEEPVMGNEVDEATRHHQLCEKALARQLRKKVCQSYSLE